MVGFYMAKKAEAASTEIPEAKIRQAIWMLKVNKTKKAVCEHIGIAYNTKRLDKLIEDFKAKEIREKELKEKAKVTALTDAIKKDIVKSYLNGEAQSTIATRYYISAQRVKAVLLESNVPIRARAKNAPAKTEHIVQDLDIKFKVQDTTTSDPLSIPPEVKFKLEEWGISLDEAVRKMIEDHDISQVWGALRHIEETWETINNPRGVFLYQVPRQEKEKSLKNLVLRFVLCNGRSYKG